MQELLVDAEFFPQKSPAGETSAAEVLHRIQVHHGIGSGTRWTRSCMVGSVDVHLSGQDHSGDSYREGLQEAENTHTTCFFLSSNDGYHYKQSRSTIRLNSSWRFVVYNWHILQYLLDFWLFDRKTWANFWCRPCWRPMAFILNLGSLWIKQLCVWSWGVRCSH